MLRMQSVPLSVGDDDHMPSNTDDDDDHYMPWKVNKSWKVFDVGEENGDGVDWKMYKYHRVDDKMSKMRGGGGPEKRRAVPKKERHGSLFLYRDNQTTRPRTHLGSITQLWWRWGIGKVSHWERDSCGFNPLLCLRIVPSSGVFVRRQISMCAAFVRLPLYTRPTSTYKALVSLWQNIAKMVSWWFPFR